MLFGMFSLLVACWHKIKLTAGTSRVSAGAGSLRGRAVGGDG
jgi:hypothetical protein